MQATRSHERDNAKSDHSPSPISFGTARAIYKIFKSEHHQIEFVQMSHILRCLSSLECATEINEEGDCKLAKSMCS